MSRLNDLVAGAIGETETDGRRKWAEAAAIVVQRADEDQRNVLAHEGAKILCKKAAQTQGRAATRSTIVSGQTELFPDLRHGYAVDDESGTIKLTDSLSQIEFRRVISVREKKIDEDKAHLKKLRDAYDAVRPLWDAHPDWSFGRCCADLVMRRRAS